jgi:hypothetical protein
MGTVRMGVCIAGAAALAASACGSGVTVKRVAGDDRTTEGIRFYRPWPNLVVTKEFPVTASACFVSGTLAANGQYIELDPEILKFINGGVLPPGAVADGGAAQLSVGALGSSPALEAGTKTLHSAGGSGAKDGGAGEGGGSSSGSGGDDGGGSAAPSADASTSVSIVAGTGTQPISLSDSLSLLYLPDESQDYVIQFSGSTQDAKLTLTSGWLLEGLNVQSQNIVANLVQNVVTSVLPSLTKLIPGLQAGTTTLSEAAKAAAAPQPVVLKVHTVQYAVPGVYPMEHGKYTPPAAAKPPVSCDPKASAPSVVDLGVFKLQTRADVLLEVQSVGDGSGAAGADKAQNATATDSSCASAVGASFGTWAKGHGAGVSVVPHVLSASGGKVTIAVEFDAQSKPAQKAAALAELKKVTASVIDTDVCKFDDKGAINVCEYGKPTCKASP